VFVVATCIGVTNAYSQVPVRSAEQLNLRRSSVGKITDARRGTPHLEVSLKVTDYELECTAGASKGCVVKPKVMMEPDDVSLLQRASGSHQMEISVCPPPHNGRGCSVAVVWDASQTDTDLRGQVTTPCQYVLGWRLGGAPFSARSNPLTFTRAGIAICSR
jgi:hypothetical protein